MKLNADYLSERPAPAACITDEGAAVFAELLIAMADDKAGGNQKPTTVATPVTRPSRERKQ